MRSNVRRERKEERERYSECNLFPFSIMSPVMLWPLNGVNMNRGSAGDPGGMGARRGGGRRGDRRDIESKCVRRDGSDDCITTTPELTL